MVGRCLRIKQGWKSENKCCRFRSGQKNPKHEMGTAAAAETRPTNGLGAAFATIRSFEPRSMRNVKLSGDGGVVQSGEKKFISTVSLQVSPPPKIKGKRKRNFNPHFFKWPYHQYGCLADVIDPFWNFFFFLRVSWCTVPYRVVPKEPANAHKNFTYWNAKAFTRSAKT